MAQLECEKCKADISEYKKRVQILDPIGFTRTFCNACGEDYNKKIEKSNASIAETGKLGYLAQSRGYGSNIRF